MYLLILIVLIIIIVFVTKKNSNKVVNTNKNILSPNFQKSENLIEKEWNRLQENFDIENSSEPLRQFKTKIVGVTYSNNDGSSRQKIISTSKVNDKIYLIPELYKKPDTYSIMVCNEKFEQLGFLNAELASEISENILNKKSRVDAKIVEIIGENKGTVGAIIEIQKYVIKNRQKKEPKEKIIEKAYDPSIKMHRLSFQRNIQASELEQNGYIENAIELYRSIIDNKKLEMNDASMPFSRLTIIYRKRKEYDKEIEVIEKWIDNIKNSSLIEDRKIEEIEKLNERLTKATNLKLKALKNN